ncbi:MAG: YMGG-like glycine zipper-containing protein [Desulfobacterales bacterium]
MKRNCLKFVAVFIMICMVSGCATMDDSTRTKAEGTGVGAATGAIVGGLLGQVIGHDTKSTLIGAAIGAAVGGGAGYLAGNTVAERKKKYANEEDRLDGEINIVAGYNNDLKSYNLQTSARIKDLDQQVADLKCRYLEGKVQVSSLKSKQDEINALINDTDKRKSGYSKELVALNDYRQNIEQSQDKVKVAKLGHEIDTLKKGIAGLDKGNRQMAQLVSSLSVRK